MSPLSQVKKSLISLRFLFNSEKGGRWLKNIFHTSIVVTKNLRITQSFSSPKQFTHVKAVNPRSAFVTTDHRRSLASPQENKGGFFAGSPAHWLHADLIYGPGGAVSWRAPVAVLPFTSHPMGCTGEKTRSLGASPTASKVQEKLSCTSNKSAPTEITMLV